MPEPAAVHAATLAALDEQIEHFEQAVTIRRTHSNPHQSTPFCAYCDKRWPCEPRRLSEMVIAALAGLRGRRSILVRHAPEWHPDLGWQCAADHGVITAWEDCPDRRDASAGIGVGE